MYARRLAGQSGSRNWFAAVIALLKPKVVRACARAASLLVVHFSFEDRVPPLLDPNNGSHDTHNVKVLVRSHLPLIGGISFISIAGRSNLELSILNLSISLVYIFTFQL